MPEPPGHPSGPALQRVDFTTMVRMFALSHQTVVTLAEVGFLLILFAGVWLVAAQIPAFKMPTARTIVAGIALAIAGVLLINRHALGSLRLTDRKVPVRVGGASGPGTSSGIRYSGIPFDATSVRQVAARPN